MIVPILIKAGTNVTTCNNSGVSIIDRFVIKHEATKNIKIEKIRNVLVGSKQRNRGQNKSIFSRFAFWRK